MPRFLIHAGQVGGKVEVDGTPVDGLTAAEVIIVPNQATRLILSTNADGVIEGEGIVELVRPGTITAQTIRELDPQEIRQRVDAVNLALADDPYAATLTVIADMIEAGG